MTRYHAYLLFILAASCSGSKSETAINQPELISYSIQRTWPHDTKAFTQGLVIHEGQLYESTGESDSWIGVVNVKTGIADRKIELDDKYFGEGITVLNKKIYQLTWKSNEGFVYSLPGFEKIRAFTYATEGWGITHNGENLIMSDGTEKLYYLDTATLQVARTVTVTYRGEPLKELNELEYADGFIYANIWRTDMIARIDASTGVADSFLDLSQLTSQAKLINGQADVLNGIAWHPETKSLLVTGKYWPLIYVLKLAPSPG
jgi:glutamine cyclotransferase